MYRLKVMNILFLFFLLTLSGVVLGQNNQAIGINTELPEATLDVNGDVIIRTVPIQRSGSFLALGINDKNQVVTKSGDITSYATYLGFQPKAPQHSVVLPITLEDGYITKITGTTIGACFGVMVDFTIVYLGKRYLGATLKAINTVANRGSFAEVVLDSGTSIYGAPLERLAKANCANGETGHTLSYDRVKNEISVNFLDRPNYYLDAGTFVIYNIDKVLQHE